MPRRYVVKRKDQVVAYVVDLVLTARLRGGHRIDRNAIAEVIGVSRVPVQEAMRSDLMATITVAGLTRRGVLAGDSG